MRTIELYEHRAKYYETDQMGIIHHSNYIRWMEEARLDFMEKIGCPYKKMEQEGIICPVLSVHCQYRSMVYFDDIVKIAVKIKKYNGIKLKLVYEMFNETTGQTCTVGESEHCFLDSNNRCISLKKVSPAIDSVFCAYMEE
ncbi:acyl-CoA thioester hydrolase [Anaerobium acetethylicum]|uniref:Acyl-CoA thioester hydrolase n=1 Tax=Anaerobium acetethylicum TaxID=1619234 RepID=A0A1D3TN80_9FIRM|nr:acyl-CoA thioesterase [Anaerobium acetethylicum]SCP94750.1 acyl-CoA thioester hydrolase [Anaerobium acetethylicum]